MLDMTFIAFQAFFLGFALGYLLDNIGSVRRYHSFAAKAGISGFGHFFHFFRWWKNDKREFVVHIENGFMWADTERSISVNLLIDGNGYRYARFVSAKPDFDEKYHDAARSYANAWMSFGTTEYVPRHRSASPPDKPQDKHHAFSVLGLLPTASEIDIARAYRALSKKHHPDTGGSIKDFVALGRARDAAMAHVRMRKSG